MLVGDEMKKEKILRIVLISIILLALIIILIVFTGKKQDNSNKEVEEKKNDDYIIIEMSEKITDIPEDDNLEDNSLLEGNWNSTHIEIYKEGELAFDIADFTDRNLQIYSSNLINVCSVEDAKLKCLTSDYAYIDNILYLSGETYLANESIITLNGDSLIIRSSKNENNYSLLYFVRE